VKWLLILFLFIPSIAYAHEYIRFGASAEQFQDTYDDRYVNESGDTMEGELSMGGFDLHFDSNMFFRRVDENQLDLYIAGNLIHTWKFIPAAVPTAPDVEFTYENDIVIALENDINLILE
jgi:hypothetical protein